MKRLHYFFTTLFIAMVTAYSASGQAKEKVTEEVRQLDNTLVR